MTAKELREQEPNETERSAFYSFVGSRIRDRRRKLNWTLVDLGKKLILSHQQVQKYEQGLVQLSAERIYVLAKTLGVSVNFFYEGYERVLSEEELSEESDRIILKRSRPLQVLIVDNDPLDELQIREILKECPIEVEIYCLHAGQQVLDLLKNKTKLFPRPDVILMELDLPQVDGLHVLREIKRDRLLKEIPVIILSNNLSKHVMIEAYKNFASGYIHKSFESADFKEQLHNTIKYWASIALPRM
ncbi:MAG: response regulator [Alphaproteobacteria bacterium]